MNAKPFYRGIEKMKKQYAEECNYWKSGKSSPDSWLEKSVQLIESFGGQVIASAFGFSKGKSAYMIQFDLEGEAFKIIWPVMKSKNDDDMAARRQSATMLYHDIKASCIAAQILGTRTVFFSWLCLPDGRANFELSNQELLENAPKFLKGNDE